MVVDVFYDGGCLLWWMSFMVDVFYDGGCLSRWWMSFRGVTAPLLLRLEHTCVAAH